MDRIGRRAAVIAVTTVFGLGVLGSAAFAALAPAPLDTFSLVPTLPGTAVAETPKGNKLKDVLDGLVSKGVITQQQEDAILGALKDASGDRDRAAVLKRIFAGLFDESATYLGVPPAQLKTKLAGTSLAAIANATAGKSRDGLVAYLTNAADDAIAKAQADGKITEAQADKATAAVPDRVAKFVDHTWPTPKPKMPNVRAFIGDVMSASRDYLGLSQKDLATQLRSGKSLGEIADATAGKSKTGLVSTLTSAANARIDKAQQDGKLTADQATQLKTKVQGAVAELVDHEGTAIKSR
ncbi:MAG TPA: hypothetical protein VFC31_14430 [Candidatus Limnocylindria bacterium]|nr:hypothetical protein [Candidatus Limnocylindria bacterium]